MSLGASFLDSYKTAETGSLRAITKLIASGQVASGLLVSQRGAGANMSVDISAGDAYLARAAGDYSYAVFNDAVYNQSITTADPSNARRDIVVIYRDLSAATNTTVSNATNGAVKIAVINGTPASTPVDPTDAAIQSAVGASNPFAKLARITVPGAAGSITNSMITDLRSIITMVGTPITNEVTFDFVSSGCIWTGDNYGTTRNASMTAGIAYISGRRVLVSAVTSRSFTASKDTYVDVDVTGTLIYTEVTNNSASPSLLANTVRLAIVVTGSSNIAASGSVNQGQEYMVLPISGGVAYSVTDSIGNLICPRDPNRKLLGYRQRITDTGIIATGGLDTPVAGLLAPCIVPVGRKVKITAYSPSICNTSTPGDAYTVIYDGVIGSGGVKLNEGHTVSPTANYPYSHTVPALQTPTSASKTYTVGVRGSGAGSGISTVGLSANEPMTITVELD